MSVMKVRDSAFDTRLRAFDIGPEGIALVDRMGGLHIETPDASSDLAASDGSHPRLPGSDATPGS